MLSEEKGFRTKTRHEQGQNDDNDTAPTSWTKIDWGRRPQLRTIKVRADKETQVNDMKEGTRETRTRQDFKNKSGSPRQDKKTPWTFSWVQHHLERKPRIAALHNTGLDQSRSHNAETTCSSERVII